MRIVLVEVREESSVGELLEARGVVCHDIGRAWEVPSVVAVPVRALVLASVVAEVSSGAVTGDGSSGDSGDGRGVVRCRGDRGVGDVVRRGDNGDLG